MEDTTNESESPTVKERVKSRVQQVRSLASRHKYGFAAGSVATLALITWVKHVRDEPEFQIELDVDYDASDEETDESESDNETD